MRVYVQDRYSLGLNPPIVNAFGSPTNNLAQLAGKERK
jgi:hypothetical protein